MTKTDITFAQAYEELVVMLEDDRDRLVGAFVKNPSARSSRAKLMQTADALLSRQLTIDAVQRILAEHRPGRADALVP
jgi:hypothetical protein